MRVLIINSNTNQSITSELYRNAVRIASPETEVAVTGAEWGVDTIEGACDAAYGALATIRALEKKKDDFDAFIIACYSDPGLYACRELTDKPVLGIAQCSMLAAAALGNKFSILSPLPRMKPALENLVRYYRLEGLCASVRTIEENVMDSYTNRTASNEAFAEQGLLAAKEDGAEVLCLGGAIFAGRDQEIAQLTGLPCIDGVSAALKMAEMYVGLGLKTGKSGLFGPLEIKKRSIK